MAINNILKSIVLDVYDHDNKTPKTIKTIAADNDVRYIAAEIQNEGVRYDISASSTVELIILRPDKVGVSVTGQPQEFTYETDPVFNPDTGETTPGETVTYYGVYAELDQAALAKSGILLGQFKITNGEQVLHTEIFKVNNGRALDAETSDWAGEYQGYNLDELVQSVNSAVAAVTEMETDVSELKTGLDSVVQGEKKTYQYGYIDCARATIPITDVTSSLYYKYLVDPCSEGDIYVINGTGSSGAKPWAFVDSAGKRLSFYQPVGGEWICDSQVIVAPANSAYLISNYHINSTLHPLAYKFGADVHGESLRIYSENAVSISANSDLNSYTTAGNYKVINATTAGSINNIPEAVGGRLSVIALSDANALHQWYISNNNNWYYRQRISGNWTAWKTVAWQGSVDIKIASLGKPIPTETNGLSQIPSNSDLNDYRTAGTYIVFTAAVAKTISNIPEYYSGRLIVMATSATAIVSQIFITNTNNVYTRIFSNSWTDWAKLADNMMAESASDVSKGAYNALQVLIKNSQYDIAFANAFAPLPMKNYLGNTQNVHPKVLYIASGFGGHKYWMAYTPYPNSNDAVENPCVAYSDDGYNWTNISGNPIDDPGGNGYNSDAHLVYREDSGTLECWYRHVGPATQTPREETIYRQTTNDGVTWSAKEMLYNNASGNYAKLLSPSVIVENGKYCIWAVNGDGGSSIDYYEAQLSNPSTWFKIRSISFSITDDGISVKPWHLDLIKDNDTYVLLLMCRNGLGIANNRCSLFVATSSDNITYSTVIKVVEGADNWDKYMYRSTIVKVNDIYRIYYSATKGGTTSIYNNAIWGIGITESSELTSGYVGKY